MKATRTGEATARSDRALALPAAGLLIGTGTIAAPSEGDLRMSDWQERITYETAPAIRAEHELRYRMAAPLILEAGRWGDLGCGNGLAAAAGLGQARPERAVLVDIAEAAVALAAAELGLADATQLSADLTDRGALERIGAALLDPGEGPVVTCFEVIEHLGTFVPLMEWAVALAREHAATFVISVPNDAFWAIKNPHHLTAWSEGAFEELVQLLPDERTLLRQVALTGSAVLDWASTPTRHELAADVGGAGSVASHLIASFGPLHDQVWRGALAVQADQLEQRRWERQRESDAAVAQELAQAQGAAVAAQDLTIARQQEELRAATRQFDEWRIYIHELERELGRPLSGGTESSSAETPA
jgi:SAM-dependent methyltransferase